jgi:aminopeptidase N
MQMGVSGRPRAGDIGRSILTALCCLVGPSLAQSPRVQSYRFSLSLPNNDDSILRVTAWISFEPGSFKQGDTVQLNLVGLTVDRVFEQGLTGWELGSRIEFGYDGSFLRVRLPDPTRARGIVVEYHGIPRDGLIIGRDLRGRRVIFGDNWPERARFWIPTLDHPSDKGQVAFSIDAPVGSGLRVVANGKSVGVSLHDTDQGRQVATTWQEDSPIPTYTMVLGAARFAVSNHRPIVHGSDTIPITVWTYPEDSAFADSGPFRLATEIVETMERLVGSFPYEKLAHVESSTRYGGMENSSAIFYAEKPYVERTMREGVVRHETSHQWFGDAVTERDWAHLWLSEGFASYFDLVIGAALHGDSVLTAGLARDARAYFTSQVVDRPLVDTAEHDPNKLLNENSYQKGAWVLHMLRGAIGDSAFFRGIREYYRVYRDSTALSSDFQRVMERAAGRSLDPFFQQWLWQPGYPRLDVRWHYETHDRRVRLEITQAQPEAWGVFRIPRLEVEAVSATGATTRRVYALDGRTTIAYFELDAAPSAIHIDPDGRLLVQSTVTP